MISKAIEIDQNFLDKIFKRKSLLYVDVARENGIFLLNCIDKRYFKIKQVYENNKLKNALIIIVSFKEEYFCEIDKAIKAANDKAILAGFTIIDDVYKDIFELFDMLDVR